MPLLTLEDFKDIYTKAAQRGLPFLLSKFNPSGQARTKSAFNETAVQSANWWIVPKVRERWNEKITGDKNKIYEDYLVERYLQNKLGLKMLSLGAGSCSHEVNFGTHEQFEEIVCNDLVQSLLDKGKRKAEKRGLQNMTFLCEDIYKLNYPKNSFDVILFHSSLHHFSDIPKLLEQHIKPWLKPDGLLVINEFVGANRLQYPKTQIKAINEGLQLIPEAYRVKFKTNIIKQKYHGPGYLRMLIADPSECIESELIRPELHKQFEILEEKAFGGNLLMPLLKDIAHHFVTLNTEKERILHQLFQLEDRFLKEVESDMLFGVYKK